MNLQFAPGMKKPLRYLAHTHIGQFCVALNPKGRKWIVTHQGVRISKAEWQERPHAFVEAQTYFDKKTAT